ncbi:MAG: HlyC/CorC family transporter [Gammaproteobacteria bacterium]|nr:HlyC/CorC family transporter [Gammaproteobacteria bacterium]
MSHYQLAAFIIILFLLIFLCGFFSLAETALMSVNRYRIRHKARLKKRSAMLILKLLKRPDRLLGMILIGNCVASIVASALATLLAEHYFGDVGVVLATISLTFVVLIFAEVAPKTVAALYPDQISKTVAYPVYVLLMLFYPFVWFTNAIANGLLKLLHVNVSNRHHEPLSREELRSVVYDTAGKMSRQYQNMLLGILDLNKVAVENVMIPRHEIHGIDITQPWDVIQKQLTSSQHDWLPVYREDIDQILGVLHLRELMALYTAGKKIDQEVLLKKLKEPYFVPEGTPLNIQLLNFQRQRKRLALIVDEYGEIQGLVSLEDILEEIVGEFTTNVATNHKVKLQADGSYLVDGAIPIRELNRATQWDLPTNGPRTLNGVIIEYLEAMPHTGTCVRINGYPIEIIEVKENRVTWARVFPRAMQETRAD